MKTIAVINQKGGVAKTTTSHNLAVGLALQGHRVLAVDLDPQANLTLLLGVDSADVEVEGTVATLFRDGARIQNILVDTVEAGVTLLPASIELAAAVENLYSVLRRETKLKKALSFVEERFDYVVMDCGPNLGVLSVNAIVAADGILVPAQLSRLSLRGLHDLLMTVAEVREGESAYDLRVVLTRVKGAAKQRQEAAWQLLEPVKERILETQIRESEAVEKSQMEENGTPAVVKERSSSNRAAQDYQALVREIRTIWPMSSSGTTSESYRVANG
jgi:chromosome partitioning protein